MERGRVKWYNPDKGYGFVGRLAGGRDCFLHASELKKAGLQDPLRENDEILFEPVVTDVGVRATQIKFIPGAA